MRFALALALAALLVVSPAQAQRGPVSGEEWRQEQAEARAEYEREAGKLDAERAGEIEKLGAE